MGANMAYLTLTQRHYQRRTAAAWAAHQQAMARAAMAATWLLGAAFLLGMALASLGAGAALYVVLLGG